MIEIGVLDGFEEDVELLKQQLQFVKEVNVLFTAESLSKLPDKHIPDILLLEPKEQHQHIIRSVKEMLPDTEIVILSGRDDLNEVRKCLSLGATSYLRKQSDMRFLRIALKITYEGESFLSPTLCKEMISQWHRSHENLRSLTARELQIAEGLMDGLSYKLIADRYEISLNTVRVYIKRIYKKLKINSKGELLQLLSA